MLFDELLRQVTIECPERGLLLRRVRDEMTVTIDAYAALYAEGIDYSTNRGVSAFKHVPEMTAATTRVEAEVKDLRSQLKKLEAKHAALARSVQVQREQTARRHDEERLFLARAQQRLEDQLAAVNEAQAAQRRALRETD
jgi:dynein light intermediate chain